MYIYFTTIKISGHHETNTEKKLELTLILEANTRPLFREEPKEAEVRRIIDIYFRSTFVTDKTKLMILNIYI